MFKALRCELFKDYHLVYLKTDVLLLADILVMFRTTCLTDYELDPSNYLRSPRMAWDAILYKTGVKLDLITDLEMLGMIEKENVDACASWVASGMTLPTITTCQIKIRINRQITSYTKMLITLMHER